MRAFFCTHSGPHPLESRTRSDPTGTKCLNNTNELPSNNGAASAAQSKTKARGGLAYMPEMLERSPTFWSCKEEVSNIFGEFPNSCLPSLKVFKNPPNISLLFCTTQN
eukprot:1511570-Rhodomonas_salina.1